MHTECTVMHNSTSSSMHNNPSVGKKQMSESFSEFSIIIFVYFTRPSFHGLGLTMKMWTEAKGEEEGIGFIQVGVILPARPASDTRAVISSCARKQRRHDVHRPPGPSRPGRNGLPSGGSRRGHGPRRRHLRAFDPGQHWPDYRKLVRQVLRSV